MKLYLLARISVTVHAQNKLRNTRIMLRVHYIQNNEQEIKTRQQRILR